MKPTHLDEVLIVPHIYCVRVHQVGLKSLHACVSAGGAGGVGYRGKAARGHIGIRHGFAQEVSRVSKAYTHAYLQVVQYIEGLGI